eukprot:SAG22_NODE_3904_length_1475_cov_1.247820_1_plen_97_part_00
MLVPVGHLAEEGEAEQDWDALVARARAAVVARLKLDDVGIDDIDAHLIHEEIYTPNLWQQRACLPGRQRQSSSLRAPVARRRTVYDWSCPPGLTDR